MSAGFAAANTVESALAAMVFTGLRRRRPGPSSAIWCMLASGALAVSASTAAALVLLLPVAGQEWWRFAVNWGVPDLAGILVPPGRECHRPSHSRGRRRLTGFGLREPRLHEQGR